MVKIPLTHGWALLEPATEAEADTSVSPRLEHSVGWQVHYIGGHVITTSLASNPRVLVPINVMQAFINAVRRWEARQT